MPSVATATATMERTFGEACQVNPQDPFKGGEPIRQASPKGHAYKSVIGGKH
jgi:hypothetical protein